MKIRCFYVASTLCILAILYFCIIEILRVETLPVASNPEEEEVVAISDSVFRSRFSTIITPSYSIYIYKDEEEISIMAFVADSVRYQAIDTLVKRGFNVTDSTKWKWD